MATIVVTHGVPAEGFDLLQGHTVHIPAPLTAFSREELARLLPQADAVVACGALDGALIRSAKRLKLIANYGSGYDAVDIAAAADCGVPVTNIPDITAEATAELAIGLMLAVSRRIGEMNLRLRHEPSEALFGMGREMGATLRGKTLGVIGMGRIGSRVAEIARALGMQMVGVTAESGSLEEVLRQADVLTLHCPLNDGTRGLINARTLAMMKPGSLLINTSRGPVVDCDALADAIEKGLIGGAGLDVFPQEPAIPQRLLGLKNVVLTPHIGTNTAETRRDMARACSQNILVVLAGKRPPSIVNGL